MNLALSLLPVGLTTAGGILISKDANSLGADDAVGQICIALAPVIPDLLSKGSANENATLKAMRAIEQVARAYRLQVNDIPVSESSPTVLVAGAQTSSAQSRG